VYFRRHLEMYAECNNCGTFARISALNFENIASDVTIVLEHRSFAWTDCLVPG
jgi:uncharacterized Zn finger protein